MPLAGQYLATRSVETPDQRLLVFFITGNPGLIDYYALFLHRIAHRLEKADETSHITVAGTSLAGFDTPADKAYYGSYPVDLAAQTDFVMERLNAKVRGLNKSMPDPPLRVILVGHSIGAYMLLEILAKVRRSPSLTSADLVCGICLFPTIVDIAKSATGRLVKWPLKIPGSARIAHLIVHFMFLLVSVSWLSMIMNMVARFEKPAANATAGFIKGRRGVRQALFLAKDEFTSDNFWDPSVESKVARREGEVFGNLTNTVREDSGVCTSDPPNTSVTSVTHPKLYFLWGQKDHWVANKTRDHIMFTRGRTKPDSLPQVGEATSSRVSWPDQECKPHMEIDTNGIPHAFPIKAAHSLIVADKVVDWIQEIQQS